MSQTTGFIGLGIMGKPMAKNLIAAGYALVVHNRSQTAVDELVVLGAQRGMSPKEVAARSDVVITMLPDGPDVEQVVLGADGVLEGVDGEMVIVDFSSISPVIARRVGQSCRAQGVEFMDCPVSGGEPGAIEGTLAIMVGGNAATFERVKPIFDVVGQSVTLTGDIGAGNITKLVNQIMVAINIAGVSEALVLATKAGLDPEVVFHAVKSGLAGSNVLNSKGPMMFCRNFEPGFRIRLHRKDLRNTLQAAEAMDLPLPITAYCQQMFGALVNDGKGDDDHSGLVQYLEAASGVTVQQKEQDSELDLQHM